MREDKPRWITTRKGVSCNMSIGSNCRCWMCQAVMKFINRHHFTTGKARLIAQDKLIDYLAWRMGYTGTKIKRLKDTFPKDNRD